MIKEEVSIFDEVIIEEENNKSEKKIGKNNLFKKKYGKFFSFTNKKKGNIKKEEEQQQIKTITKNNFWATLLRYFLLGLLFLLLLFLFLYIWNYFNEYENIVNNKVDNNKSEFLVKNKGIVSEENISKYKENSNNKVIPLGDVTNDNQNDYIVMSNEIIPDSIIKNIYISFPEEPDLNCEQFKYDKSWYKNNIGYTDKVEQFILNETGTGSKISIAIVDSGISKHEQYFENIDKEDLEFNIDKYGHGTNVAGIINFINPMATLIPIKITDEKRIASVDIINGLKEAIDQKPNIINLSFSGKNKNNIEENLIKEAVDKGIIVIAAAGNESEDVSLYFPANYNNVLVSGSNGPENNISLFSNYGEGINLLLPGECIYTTFINNEYAKISGTSFSAAMLSGIISLYLQTDNDKEKLIDNLLETATEHNGYLIPNVEKLLGLTEDINNFDLEKCEGVENKFEELKQLIKLKENLVNFVDTTNENNLVENFKLFKEDSQFLNNEIIKKEKNKDDQLNNIYNDLINLYGKKDTYASTDKALGIEINYRDMSVIIPVDSVFPIKKSKVYLTRTSFQKDMSFKVYQGNNVIASKNDYLGEFIIPNLKPIEEIGPRVEVTFDIEKDGKINFIAKDIKNKHNVINGFLYTEADLLMKTNNQITEIKEVFNDIIDKVEVVIDNNL